MFRMRGEKKPERCGYAPHDPSNLNPLARAEGVDGVLNLSKDQCPHSPAHRRTSRGRHSFAIRNWRYHRADTRQPQGPCRLAEGGHARDRSGDRKSTRLNPVTNAQLVCRLLLEKKK